MWFHRDGRCELYDVVHDLGETRDLSAAEPERTAALRKLLREHLQATGAALPTRKDGSAIGLP
jgi:hypothetical protein